MASIKEATERALAFAQATLGPERTASARLEEIESTTVGGEDAWLITLSMFSPDDILATTLALGGGKRDYKTFTVLKRNGDVTAMKIRQLADA